MSDSRFQLQPALRQEWIRYRDRSTRYESGFLRAGVAGAYLPRLLLQVPHVAQERIADCVPCCATMVLRSLGREAEPAWLADLLRTDDLYGTSGRRLDRLRAWGLRVDSPRDLERFRDGTVELNRRLASESTRLVFRWEEAWLRYVRDALTAGTPPILFVDVGRLCPSWRGLPQRHAVVLAGGDGRQAWIHDPSRPSGPTRVGLSTLMDALLPGEPLATLLSLNVKCQMSNVK